MKSPDIKNCLLWAMFIGLITIVGVAKVVIKNLEEENEFLLRANKQLQMELDRQLIKHLTRDLKHENYKSKILG